MDLDLVRKEMARMRSEIIRYEEENGFLWAGNVFLGMTLTAFVVLVRRLQTPDLPRGRISKILIWISGIGAMGWMIDRTILHRDYYQMKRGHAALKERERRMSRPPPRDSGNGGRTTGEGPWRPLITGASGGIGLEFARLFAADGHDLVLVARSEDKMAGLGGGASQEARDRDRGASRRSFAGRGDRRSVREGGENGLGDRVFGQQCRFGDVWARHAEIDWDGELRTLRVNVMALTHLTKLFLPAAVRRGSGRILNVASTAAFQPGPMMAVYFASKSYVVSFSQALAHELRGTGVSVTTLCPGPGGHGVSEGPRA